MSSAEMTDEDGEDNPSHIYEGAARRAKYAIRNRILNEGIRPDGRSLTQSSRTVVGSWPLAAYTRIRFVPAWRNTSFVAGNALGAA